MSDKSAIEWTDATWNPIRGTKGKWHCTKVSEGCRNCYAERMNIRFGGPPYVKGTDTLRLDEKVLEQPLHWKRPRMVFVCSMTDLFHEDVRNGWLRRIFRVMMDAPQHTYQILTKRPHRLQHESWRASLSVLPNAWLGVSVEDQAAVDERIPLLLNMPVAVRFVSCEPLLGPVTLWREYRVGNDPAILYINNVNWVICGGESGPKARPMHPDWARSLRDQCQAVEVPFLFKQWGAWQNGSTLHQRPKLERTVLNDGTVYTHAQVAACNVNQKHRAHWGSFAPIEMARVGKKAAGRELDGLTWDQMPTLAEKRND